MSSATPFLAIATATVLSLASPVAHAFVLSYGSSGAATGDQKAFVSELVSAFRAEHPEVPIEERDSTSYTKPMAEVLMYAHEDGAPDAAVVGLVEWPLLVRKNLLRPLSQVLSKKELSDIRRALRRELTVQSHGRGLESIDYALPFNRALPALFVNQKLLPGLKTASLSWDELEHALERAKLKLTVPLDDWTIEHFFMSERGGPTLKGSSSALADEPAQRVLSHLAGLREKGLIELVADEHQAFLDFTQGLAAAALMTSSAYTSVRTRADFPFRLLMAPRQRHKLTVLGGGDLVLPLHPDKPLDEKTRADLAKFVRWFYLGAGAADWARIAGFMPVTTAALHSKRYQDFVAMHRQDEAVLMSADHWKIGSFYELSEFCNMIPLRKIVTSAITEAVKGPGAAVRSVLEKNNHALESALAAPCL